MKKRIISIFILLSVVMCLSGCVDVCMSESDSFNSNTFDESAKLEKAYIYIYRPDGTFVDEGFPEYCVSNYGVVTVVLDGIRYVTDYSNVLVVFRQLPAQ